MNPGDEVLVSAPYWVSYPEQIGITGAKMIAVETSVESDFKWTVTDLKAAFTNKTKAIVLNSPSNPTGTIYTEDELRAICEWAVENDLWIISDEIYDKLIYEGSHICVPSLSSAIKDRTILVNGVSKSYAMTGWRIAFLRHLSRLLQRFLAYNLIQHPTSIAQYAAIEVYQMDQSILNDMRSIFNSRRELMIGLLKLFLELQ